MPRLSPTRRMAGANRHRKASCIPRRALLGASGPSFRRPEWTRAGRGPRAGGTRRESHRPDVHGRSFRRLAVPSTSRCRLREPTYLHLFGRRVGSDRPRRDSRCPLCAASEPAYQSGTRRMPPVARGRTGRPDERSCHRGSRRLRLSADAANPGGSRALDPQASAEVRARSRGGGVRRTHGSLLLSSEPAEHVHWQTHRTDVRQYLESRPSVNLEVASRVTLRARRLAG